MREDPDILRLFREAAQIGSFSFEERTYAKNDHLFRQDDESGGVHIILCGLVKSCMLAENGKETMVALSGPGETIGEMEFFLQEPILCSVFALGKVQTLYANRQAMEIALHSSPRLGSALARILALRLKRSSLRVLTSLVFPLEYNLLKAVLTRLDSPVMDYTEIRKAELADYLGGTSRHLNRVLHDLSNQGVITVSGSRVVGVDRKKAKELLNKMEG